jgi:hypothetical protein
MLVSAAMFSSKRHARDVRPKIRGSHPNSVAECKAVKDPQLIMASLWHVKYQLE